MPTCRSYSVRISFIFASYSFLAYSLRLTARLFFIPDSSAQQCFFSLSSTSLRRALSCTQLKTALSNERSTLSNYTWIPISPTSFLFASLQACFYRSSSMMLALMGALSIRGRNCKIEPNSALRTTSQERRSHSRMKTEQEQFRFFVRRKSMTMFRRMLSGMDCLGKDGYSRMAAIFLVLLTAACACILSSRIFSIYLAVFAKKAISANCPSSQFILLQANHPYPTHSRPPYDLIPCF